MNQMKLYFCDQINEERCFDLKYIKQKAIEMGLESIEVFEASPEYGTGYFYCKEYMDVGEVGEGCGKECDKYSPRNGKNGRCRHSGYVYDYDPKKPIKIDLNDKIRT